MTRDNEHTPPPQSESPFGAPVPIITEADLKPPGRINTFAAPLTEAEKEELLRRYRFVYRQVEKANQIAGELNSLERPPTALGWEAIHASMPLWRSSLGVALKGTEVVAGNRNMLTPISDGYPNLDRVGPGRRFYDKATWSRVRRRWVGGQVTPAAQALIEAGERAQARFGSSKADVFQNMVTLPDAEPVPGNRILRGKTARRRLKEQRRAIVERGGDVSRFEIGRNPILLETATEENRAQILQAAMRALARLGLARGRCDPLEVIDIDYLLFQAPAVKKGSDSNTRTFAAPTSAYLLGKTIVLPPDADLWAATGPQEAFIHYVADFNSL